jgi:hypothetical protein
MLSAVAAQEQPAPRAPAPAAAAQARGTAERGRETDGGQLDSPLAPVASHRDPRPLANANHRRAPTRTHKTPMHAETHKPTHKPLPPLASPRCTTASRCCC